MSAKIKKELILDGLDCANCSAKIEAEVKKIDGISANMNFITKTLTIEHYGDHKVEEILDRVTAIINKHEPQVIIKEKTITKGSKKTFVLMGLGCANCASKMESQIRNLSGVNNATVDFVSQKLIIETNNGQELNRIIKDVKVIVRDIEPNVEVVGEDETIEEGKTHLKDNGESKKKEILRIGIGGALFFLGLLLPLTNIIKLIVFLISYVLVGGEVLLRASKNILRGQIFDENFLMSIATIGAFLIGEFPEGVAVMLFYQVGELFQDMAVDRSRRSISDLMDIRPDFASLKDGNDYKRVSPEEVSIGDIIMVKPGEKVPLDGEVLSGISMVDTSALTGESIPREVEPGSEVLSGFINNNGLLTVEVKKEFGESTVAKILDLVENASSRKAQTENFITKFARYYTPVVVLTALFIAIIPPLVMAGEIFSDWFYRALIFLVISCPCALVVSIPLGFFGGIGGASKSGILVKGSNYLEALNSVETLVFDKTGTLTKGVFAVTEINAEKGYSKDEVLKYAAHAEGYSNHPIAASILAYYGKEIDKNKLKRYEEVSGYGIKVNYEGKEILTGNYKLMDKGNINYVNVESTGTVVHVALNNKYIGNIIISDEVKEDSAKSIMELKGLGIKNIIMLTGDIQSVGEKVGNMLGVDEVHAELLPHEKVEQFESLDSKKSPKRKLAFVGDGINDAPVLARADIGIAMGGLGSDAAIEAADIVIMNDEPSKIVTAIRIAKKTRQVVWQNIVFALGIKALVLGLGALGMATMWEAVFADVGVSLIAVLNSMRVMNTEKL